MVGIEISTRVLRALELIETKYRSFDDLLALYTNSVNDKLVSEIERELLTQKLEIVLRTNFPSKHSQANIILGKGNKNDKPVEQLELLYNKIAEDFNLSDNLHKNGVKVSGSMIGGRDYIGWYISYKNREGWGTSIAYRQKEIDTEPSLEIRIYQVGSKGSKVSKDNVVNIKPSKNISSLDIFDERHTFKIWESTEALDDYYTCLSLVDCPKRRHDWRD